MFRDNVDLPLDIYLQFEIYSASRQWRNLNKDSTLWLIRISHFCLQNFVHELSAETREELLVVLLSQGKGSLDFARNILRESGDEQYDPEL